MGSIKKADLKFHDVGIQRRRDITAPEPVSPIVRPNLHLSEGQLPELEGKEIGGKCHLVIIGKITAIREPMEFDDVKTPQYDLKIMEIAYLGTEDRKGNIKYTEGYKE